MLVLVDVLDALLVDVLVVVGLAVMLVLVLMLDSGAASITSRSCEVANNLTRQDLFVRSFACAQDDP